MCVDWFLNQSFFDLILWRCFIIKQDLPINEQIRASKVQLIDENGEKKGVVSLSEALDMAFEKKLDLVMVSPNPEMPVCKIMNYGKYKFEQSKREKEARKKQKSFEVKEIRITPNIDTHDFEFKAKNARKFLEREMNYIKLGEEVLQKFIDDLSDISVPEKKPLLEGKNMFIILAKKADK